MTTDNRTNEPTPELRAAEMTASEAIELVLKRPGMYGLTRTEEFRKAEAERDAALAVVERVRSVVNGPHPANSGLDSFTLAHISAALDGAPELEWEHSLLMTESDGSLAITAWKPDEFEYARKAWPGVVYIERRRRKAGTWLPVEGESNDA